MAATAQTSESTASVEINLPVETVYNQWTQFEEFPRFMEGVERVEQHGDDQVMFHVEIGGRDISYEAEITEQIPDKRIAWQAREGRDTGGVVTFHRLADDVTRVTLQLKYAPEGVLENVADLVGIVKARAKGDLQRFKDFIETRGQETGVWRGDIQKQ